MTIPYCGIPPVPGALADRWNLDPLLLAVLAVIAVVQLATARPELRRAAAAGWLVATLALVSPLCALSVSLFSARVGQHMILVLFAAPLIGYALPAGRWSHSVWWSVLAFTAAFWAWHMPVPYDATFRSDFVYWSMHATLFGSAVWLWRDLLNHRPEQTLVVIAAGTAASMQMALLGAVLTLASHPLFAWHYATTAAWHLSPLEDQQLGGALMWVPAGVFFLFAALRSASLLWQVLDRPAAG